VPMLQCGLERSNFSLAISRRLLVWLGRSRPELTSRA